MIPSEEIRKIAAIILEDFEFLPPAQWATLRVLIALALQAQREAAIRECLDIVNEKFPCQDPHHDPRYCATCEHGEDRANLIAQEIETLLPAETKEKT